MSRAFCSEEEQAVKQTGGCLKAERPQQREMDLPLLRVKQPAWCVQGTAGVWTGDGTEGIGADQGSPFVWGEMEPI